MSLHQKEVSISLKNLVFLFLHFPKKTTKIPFVSATSRRACSWQVVITGVHIQSVVHNNDREQHF